MTEHKIAIIAVSGSCGSGMTTLCDQLSTALRSFGKRVVQTSMWHVSDCAAREHLLLTEGTFARQIRTDEKFKTVVNADNGEKISLHELRIQIMEALYVGVNQSASANNLTKRIVAWRKDESPPDVVIVDDVRMPEEIARIRKLKGKIIRLPAGYAGMSDAYAAIEHPGGLLNICDFKDWDLHFQERQRPSAMTAIVLAKFSSYVGLTESSDVQEE